MAELPARTLRMVRERLAAEDRQPSSAPGRRVSPEGIAAALSATGVFGQRQLFAAVPAVEQELAGCGWLTALLGEPGVSDVLVNGPREVWVDRGTGLARVPARFADEPAVRALAQRLAALGGRRLDDAQPFADVRLPGGIRLHAVLAPTAPGGTCLSFRVAARRTFTLTELVSAGFVPAGGAELLAALVASRLAFLVSGGTGVGKTTLLSTLLSLVEPAHRLVLVEELSELRPEHPHVVRLESRSANSEGAGRIELSALVRQAVRMRPDRLVVGEARGAEVADLLAALNTGHQGGCGTLHANRADQVPARVEALAALAGLGRQAAHAQLAAAAPVVLHLERSPAGRRQLVEVAVLDRQAHGLVRAVTAVRVVDDELQPGPAGSELRRLLR